MLALETLEFDRVVELVTSLALTPIGASALESLQPHVDPREVAAALDATSEASAYLEGHDLFPLRAPSGLRDALAVLEVEGQALEPLALRAVADFLDSVETTCAAIRAAGSAFPLLGAIAARAPGFAREIANIRRAIDPSGEVVDEASPALKSIRDQLRARRARLRSTLEEMIRGRDAARYLQEQVITERNGRSVLMIRAEHRGSLPGIVHGSSASGATLFMEPAATVEINNDIVELQEREREEVMRILRELTDAFRRRSGDLERALDAAAELDVLQAKARFGALVQGAPPQIAIDGRLEIRGARHPLLIGAVRQRLGEPPLRKAGTEGIAPGAPREVVPIDIVLDPPARVLLITGPNTGGKTVAIKTAGLLALMAQAGLFVPAAAATLPVFRSIFADIGDEQSIAASLSTFSGHITNIVAMDRELELPALVILDEVGTGTDPQEGGALATAIVNHFKQRGAHVIATTHYEALKSWGTTTEGVVTAGFAFDPQTFAPTYRLVYGVPGRSLAIEIAQRLGLPLAVIAAARGFLSDDQKRVAAHLARLDAQARALEGERARLQRERRALDAARRAVEAREAEVAAREERLARRLNEKIDDRIRQARREIDEVIAQLKERAEELAGQAGRRAAAAIPTGETGAARAAAREKIARIVDRLKEPAPPPGPAADLPPVPGARVAIGPFGMEGTILAIHGQTAEIDVRGKRLRAPVADLRVVARDAPASAAPRVRVSVDLRPREGSLTELNVIGATVDQAIERIARFLDDTLVTDQRQVRIVHGHGTGQLRRGIAAYLKEHPLVATFYPAPREQGGEGATIVELKE
jgi:DNA mismatch repair protein MutS2